MWLGLGTNTGLNNPHLMAQCRQKGGTGQQKHTGLVAKIPLGNAMMCR